MFREGDLVLLKDKKGRKYLITLKKGKAFEFHHGKICHDEILKKKVGESIFSSKGKELLILKPTLAEFILKRLKRKTQIIYPKDAGQILVLADIFEGAKVLECGTGSGALTLYLLRQVGKDGRVFSIDVRKDMIRVAQKNIEDFFQKPIEKIENLILRNQDLKDLEEKDFDRVVLDLPNPWDYLEKIKEILKPGGILACWLPTVLQIFTLVDKAQNEFYKNFNLEGIFETLQREWQKEGKSLRPKDQMVAHTGFLITLRKKI